MQVVECAVNNVTVVPCHSIHALLSSLDELAQQATVEVRLPNVCSQCCPEVLKNAVSLLHKHMPSHSAHRLPLHRLLLQRLQSRLLGMQPNAAGRLTCHSIIVATWQIVANVTFSW